jgi:hypothetical protein
MNVRITWIVVAALVMTAGCQRSEPVLTEPVLVDADGVVEQHQFLLPAPEHEILPHLNQPVDDDVLVLDGPDWADVRVVWTGLPCQLAPTVEISRLPDGLSVSVTRGPEVLGVGQACPSSEDYLAIDLAFADGVATDRVTTQIE